MQGTLFESMWALRKSVDEIHVCDGRYLEFKCPCGHSHDNSCDRTELEVRAFQERHPDLPVFYHKWPAMNENEKRTRMFDFLGDEDVALIVDDDEIYFDLTGARRFTMLTDERVGWVLMLSPRAAKDYTARLFRKSPGLHYESYAVLKDDKGLVCDIHHGFETHWQGCCLLDDVRVVHLYGEGVLGSPGYRASAEREQARVIYDEMLRKRDWK